MINSNLVLWVGLSLGVGLDLSAGKDHAGVTGGLGGKVIRAGVDDHRFSDDLAQGKAVCEEYRKRPPVGRKQGQQIPGMVGMAQIAGVIVGSRCSAVASGVNMKGINAAGAGQAGHRRPNQHPKVCGIKSHHALHVVFPASDTGHRTRAAPTFQFLHNAS